MRREIRRKKIINTKRTAHQLRCVDLFAGAGGFSLAAARAGLNVVAAVEVDPNACKTYHRNFSKKASTKLYEKDITGLDPKLLVADCMAHGGDCDVVLGGPPCQGFSVHRINDAGKDDPRNQLIHRYFEFVSALRPKIFLMENVPGMLWPRHAVGLAKFYSEAEAAGYQATAVVLDARNYGLPQRRKRVFVLGVRSDLIAPMDWPPKPTHGNSAQVARNPKLRPWLSCAEVFARKTRKNDPNDIHMQHSKELIKVFKKTPKNGGSRSDSGRVLPCHKHHNGHKDVYGRINPKEPAPTMTTACINPSKGRFLHPTKHHGISLRHAARLQGFPDSFVFEGGLMAGGVQVGNAVPIPIAELLIKRATSILSANLHPKAANDSIGSVSVVPEAAE